MVGGLLIFLSRFKGEVFGHVAIYLGGAHWDMNVSMFSVKLSNAPFGTCLCPAVIYVSLNDLELLLKNSQCNHC